jgi:hypothetical protein
MNKPDEHSHCLFNFDDHEVYIWARREDDFTTGNAEILEASGKPVSNTLYHWLVKYKHEEMENALIKWNEHNNDGHTSIKTPY